MKIKVWATGNVVKQKISFYKRLSELGYKDYNCYLKSEHWKRKKEEYKNSDMLQCCLVCKSEYYILHHRSYARLGNERLSDFVPLCRDCHTKVHQWFEENKTTTIYGTHRAIREVFKLTKRETRKLFRIISKGKKAYKMYV